MARRRRRHGSRHYPSRALKCLMSTPRPVRKSAPFVAHPNLRPPLLIQVVSPATLAALIRRNCPLLALRPAVRRRRGSRAPPILATVVKASSH